MRIKEPLSQQELKMGDLAPKGEYPFLVLEASEEISQKSGDEMIKLKVKVYADRERTIFDYLIESMAFKLGHFAEATGLQEKYHADKCISAHDCEGKTGYLKLGIDDGSKSGFSPKNVVLDYIPTDEVKEQKASAKAAVAESQGAEFKDDDLPF